MYLPFHIVEYLIFNKSMHRCATPKLNQITTCLCVEKPSLIALAPTLVNGILVPIQSTQKLVSNDTIGIESHQFSFKYDSATTFRSIDREKKHITVKQSFIGSASTPMKNYIATTEIHQRSAHISQNDSLKQHSISMSGQIIRLDMPEKDSYRTESAVKNRNLDKNISEKTKNNPETNKESSNEAITNGEFLKLKIQNDTAASTNEVKLMKDSPIRIYIYIWIPN